MKIQLLKNRREWTLDDKLIITSAPLGEKRNQGSSGVSVDSTVCVYSVLVAVRIYDWAVL